MRLPVAAREDGDLTSVNDAGLQPLKNIAVTVTVDEGLPACIFDGYVLSHKLVAKSGMRASSLEVYGQDAAWLMNLEEKTREWANVTEGMAANTIFSEYGFLPDPSNMEDDSGPYTPEGHTLMQRGTDWEFLKMLARRSGRLCRVAGGMTPGMNIGIFAAPKLDAEPVATLKLNDPAAPNTAELTFEWDVMRPTAVKARQALLAGGGAEGAAGDAAGSGLTPLDERDLATFAGMPMTAMLTTAADDTGQVGRRAAALLRDAGWFVKCTGEVDAGALRQRLVQWKIQFSESFICRPGATASAARSGARACRAAAGVPPAGCCGSAATARAATPACREECCARSGTGRARVRAVRAGDRPTLSCGRGCAPAPRA